MNWEQRFEEAFESGRFEVEDFETAYRLLESAAYDVLCKRGYDRSYKEKRLGEIIREHDEWLWKANSEFAEVVSFMDYEFIGLAQRSYNRIQNMDLSQALIDKLELTANSKAPLNHNWAPAHSPFF